MATAVTFTPGTQTPWTVPSGVTAIQVTLTGGSGAGSLAHVLSVAGGVAGMDSFAVTPGEILYFTVGGAGSGLVGGYNGGGAGGDDTANTIKAAGSAGGGATDIRRGGSALANRIVVVPGGIGASGSATIGTSGGDASGSAGGIAGGTGGAGGLLTGGAGATNTTVGQAGAGGGAGGLYGGGGGGSGVNAGNGGNGSFLLAGFTNGYAPGSGTSILYNTPPNAPIITAPTNASYADFASGGQAFSWTYSDNDLGDSQAAYAFRRKISGAPAYEYWNVASGVWQSTLVYNPTSSTSVSFAVGKWTNGNTYQWSISTTDNAAINSFSGPFASDLTITAQTPPSVVVTAPTGTVLTAAPTITWTDTLPSGAAQSAYRVVVESGAYGTSPGLGTKLYDSGVTGGAALSQVASGLTNYTTTRAFVQVTETGGQVSAWGYGTFTVALDGPATPALTAAWDATLQRTVLTVQGKDNLLSLNQGSLETDTTGWSAAVNSAIARTTAQALNGVASLAITSVAAGDMQASTLAGTSGFPVVVGQFYTALGSFRAATAGRSVAIRVAWYTAAGVGISTSVGANVTDTTTGWTQATLAVQAPATAAFVTLVPYITGTAAASEVHYADALGIYPDPTSSSTTWYRGGIAGTGVAGFQRSLDGGVTWTTCRVTALLPGPAQFVTAYDYEATPGQTVTYRASVTDIV